MVLCLSVDSKMYLGIKAVERRTYCFVYDS